LRSNFCPPLESTRMVTGRKRIGMRGNKE
jgi:CheY-like chemotaxis protein/DNA-binding XRE family transcriptional regulator